MAIFPVLKGKDRRLCPVQHQASHFNIMKARPDRNPFGKLFGSGNCFNKVFYASSFFKTKTLKADFRKIPLC
jgi:hypothetical protein